MLYIIVLLCFCTAYSLFGKHKLSVVKFLLQKHKNKRFFSLSHIFSREVHFFRARSVPFSDFCTFLTLCGALLQLLRRGHSIRSYSPEPRSKSLGFWLAWCSLSECVRPRVSLFRRSPFPVLSGAFF
jgi:hypothetical protein